MTIKIEKDTKFDVNKMETIIKYYIWVDDRCIHMTNTEDEAKDAIEKIKANYISPATQIIYEETI